MAVEAGEYAGRAALAAAGLEGCDLSHVMSWSLIPDRPGWTEAPGIAHRLGAGSARALGIDSSTPSVLDMADIADALMVSRRAGPVLCVVTNLITRAVVDHNPIRRYLGDAAAAVVLVPGDQPLILASNEAPTAGNMYDAVYCGRDDGTRYWERSREAMHPMCDMTRYKDLVDTAPYYAEKAIRAVNGWNSADWILAPQDRGWMRETVGKRLDALDRMGPDVFRAYGCIGPCAPIVAWEMARATDDRGQRVATYLHGAGLTQWAGMLAI